MGMRSALRARETEDEGNRAEERLHVGGLRPRQAPRRLRQRLLQAGRLRRAVQARLGAFLHRLARLGHRPLRMC